MAPAMDFDSIDPADPPTWSHPIPDRPRTGTEWEAMWRSNMAAPAAFLEHERPGFGHYFRIGAGVAGGIIVAAVAVALIVPIVIGMLSAIL